MNESIGKLNCSNSALHVTSTVLYVVPAALVIALIIFGNLLVVIAVSREPKLKRQIQNWFIVSLAMADFLVGLLIMPISLTFEALDCWVLGQVLCELWLALDVLFVTASILNLCLISLDRYWSIVHTLRYINQRTPARALGMIAGVWIIALLISFPPLVGWKAEYIPGRCSLSTDPGYVCYSALGSFFLPVTVLVFVYAQIFKISRRRNRARRKAAKKTCETMLTSMVIPDCSSYVPSAINREAEIGSTQESTPEKIPMRTGFLNRKISHDESRLKDTSTPSSPRKVESSRALLAPTDAMGGKRRCEVMNEDQLLFLKKQKKLRSQDRRATFILGIVLSSFIICWLPFFTLYILAPLGLQAPERVFDIIFWLGYCNSALNPLIYTVMNRDFKKAFKRILTCDFWK